MTEYWIGGYTASGAGGVRRLVPGSDPTEIVVTTGDPSYLLASPAHAGLLYAVDEGGDAVVAIRVSGSGTEVVARVPAAGSAPCHLALVADGAVLLASCYEDGVVSAHRIDPDGKPAAGIALPSPDPAPVGPHPAQDGPHAHCTLELGDLLLVADLGTDRVLVYRRAGGWFAFDSAIALPAAAGPRDLLLHPSGTVLLLGEHDARVHVLDVDRRSVRSSVPTTTDPAEGDQAAGMTLTGDLLTVGLRGSDRIAVLRVDADATPRPVSSAPAGGAGPRHHVVSDGRVLIADERSDRITALPIRADGALGDASAVASSPAPTFLLAVE